MHLWHRSRRNRRTIADRLTLLRLLERLDVLDQRNQLFFTHYALKRRHDRLESRNHLGGGIGDGFADVILIGDHSSAVVEQNRLAEDPIEIGPAALRIEPVTSGAPEFLKQLLPRGRKRSFRPAPRQPLLVLR